MSFHATKLFPRNPPPVRALVRLGVVEMKFLLSYRAEHKNANIVVANFSIQDVHYSNKFDVFKRQVCCTLFKHLSLCRHFKTFSILLMPPWKLPHLVKGWVDWVNSLGNQYFIEFV